MRAWTLAFALIAPAAIAAADAHKIYDERWAPRLVPMVVEVVRFPTYAGNARAHADQHAWLAATAKELGFGFADRGKVAEIELPGPAGAPVLGLIVHGDVVPVDDHWTFPPFEATVRDGAILGRGTADDKGPLVQALLAMKSLADSGVARTHTVRLLVGSDEESGSTDLKEYLQQHRAPDVSLVLDGDFPVDLGEMAFNMLFAETKLDNRGASDVRVAALSGGLAANIIPDTASARLEGPPAALAEIRANAKAAALPPGITLSFDGEGGTLVVTAHGKAAHSAANPRGGRNAIVGLAHALEPLLPPGGAKDLLAFAKIAGVDVNGTGLGLTESHPVFGRAIAAPTVIRALPEGKFRLGVNVRSVPGSSGTVLRTRLHARVREFNAATGASLEPGGSFVAQPLEINPGSKLARRLLAAYRRATGREDAPTVSAGTTYAKVVPDSLVFGMWLPGKPYPGHDVDEKNPIADLHLGTHVLIEALLDLACNAPIKEPRLP